MSSKRILTNKQYILISFLFDVISFIIFAIVLTPFDETNDDTGMALFIENAFGQSNGVVIFQNIIYTKGLQLLYGMLPSVKWCFVIQLLFAFISLFIIMFIMFKRLGLELGILVNSFLAIFSGYNFFHIFQFTRIASIIAVAGILIIFDSFSSKNKCYKIIKIIIGIVMISFSSCIRKSAFLMVVAMMSVIGVDKIIEIVKSKTNITKRILCYFLVFGISFSIPLILIGYDSYYYNSHQELSDTLELNTSRSNLYDYNWPDYEKNKEMYEDLEITKEDFDFYNTWNMDTNRLTKAKMDIISKSQKNIKNEKRVALVRCCYTILRFFSNSLTWVYLLISIICFLSNRKKLILIIMQFFILMIMYIYLGYQGRGVGMPRVETGLFFSGIITVLTNLDLKINIDIKKSFKTVLFIFIIASFLVFSTLDSARHIHGIKYNKQSDVFYSKVEIDKEHLYVSLLDPSTRGASLSNKFYEASKSYSLSNVYSLGGWGIYLPVSESILKEYNIENVYRDSINNDKVYFVANELSDELISYINRNYDEKAKLQYIDTIEDNNIWRVVSK